MGQLEYDDVSPSCGSAKILHEVTHKEPGVESVLGGGGVCALTTSNVIVHDLEKGAEKANFETTESYSNSCLSSDPHSPHLLTLGSSTSLLTYDLRTGDATGGVKNAHKHAVLSCSYNPHRPYYVVSGGKDGSVRFWDVRFNGGEVVERQSSRVLEGHEHWVRHVRYNPFHDQLVASGGTDGTVGLWRVSSVSSAPIMTLTDNDVSSNPSVLPDARVGAFNGHDQGVTGVEWSRCDAWCMASTGWGGTVIVDHVASEEKYRILL